MTKFSRRCSMATALIAVAFASVAFASTAAQAATAVFVTPSTPTASQATSLSTQGDNAGFQLFLGQTLALRFNDPVVALAGERTSVFTLAEANAASDASIDVIVRAGLFNNGAPIIVGERSVQAGAALNLVGPVLSACRALGGCDYLEFILGNARNGANSATIDYVSVGGEVVQVAGPDPITGVASPTPEPQVWVLMILGFAAVAWRMKALRPQLAQPLAA